MERFLGLGQTGDSRPVGQTSVKYQAVRMLAQVSAAKKREAGKEKEEVGGDGKRYSYSNKKENRK